MSQAGFGLLGGTFDPVHCAHIGLAHTARTALHLERVLLLPAAEPPLKPGCAASADHRLRMVELAVEGEDGLTACALELERSGPSYTVDTLRELARRYPDRGIWFVIGSDALGGLDSWHEPAALFDLASFAVVEREPAPGDAALERLLPAGLTAPFRRGPHGWVHASGHELRRLPFEPTPISSSSIRERLRTGQSVRGQLPDPVIEYIQAHGLYQEDS